MDNGLPCNKEVSEELTRESLIAISNSVPDKASESNLSLDPFIIFDGFSASSGDVAEHFRSELISISDAQSPDVKA